MKVIAILFAVICLGCGDGRPRPSGPRFQPAPVIREKSGYEKHLERKMFEKTTGIRLVPRGLDPYDHMPDPFGFSSGKKRR